MVRHFNTIARRMANILVLLQAIHGRVQRALLQQSISAGQESELLVFLDKLPSWQSDFLKIQQALASSLSEDLPDGLQDTLAVAAMQALDADLLFELISSQLLSVLSLRLC